MKHTQLLAATAVVALFGTGAMATTISLDNIVGDWDNVVGDNQGSVINNGDPVSSVRWPDHAGGQSGYDFEAVATPLQSIVPPERPYTSDPFAVGTFTHFNQAIPSGSGIDSVELQLTMDGLIGGVPWALAPTWLFDHNETPNRTPCPQPPGSGPIQTVCDDFVTVSLAQGSTETSVTIGKERYTFTLLGFSTDGGTTISTLFQSPEGGNNSAVLYAQYSVSIIPLPAAGWLLLGGLGALGAVARRRRKQA
jgi:hypothetical protein